MPSLKLSGYSLAGAASTRLKLRGYSIGGINRTSLRLCGYSIGGVSPGLTVSNRNPDSGETVTLIYGGATSIIVWRRVSGPTVQLTATGSTCKAVMPIITTAQRLVIGAKDGTQPEKTIELIVAPTPHYYCVSATQKVPYVIEYVP